MVLWSQAGFGIFGLGEFGKTSLQSKQAYKRIFYTTCMERHKSHLAQGKEHYELAVYTFGYPSSSILNIFHTHF